MEFKDIDLNKINKNPYNWRKHPNKQKRLLNRVINEVGWVGAVLYNERTEHLIDGELRFEEAIKRREKTIPAIVVNVDEDIEKKLLATFDKVTLEAANNKEAYIDLVEDIEFDDEMLNLEIKGAIDDNENEIQQAEKEIIPELLYEAKYVTLIFKDDMNWEWAKKHFNLGIKKDPNNNSESFCYVVDGDKYIQKRG